MDRRWSQRTPMWLEVEMSGEGFGTVIGQTRDVGLGGVFLETREQRPARGAFVHLIFKVGNSGHVVKYRVKAKVMREDGQGLGLMFRDIDATAFRSLQEIMRLREMEAGDNHMHV